MKSACCFFFVEKCITITLSRLFSFIKTDFWLLATEYCPTKLFLSTLQLLNLPSAPPNYSLYCLTAAIDCDCQKQVMNPKYYMTLPARPKPQRNVALKRAQFELQEFRLSIASVARAEMTLSVLMAGMVKATVSAASITRQQWRQWDCFDATPQR